MSDRSDVRSGARTTAPSTRHRRRCGSRQLTKQYGPSEVLSQVSFDVAAGEVVGLIGTNGAGKSTLIKILSGAIGASGGTVEVGGEPFAPATPLDARRAGVQTVHQEIDAGIVPGTSVADNLTLDSLAPRAGGLFRSARRTRQAARVVAENAGLHVDVDASIESLPASERQQVVIARALSHHVKVLVLDEPTSSLSSRDTDTSAGVGTSSRRGRRRRAVRLARPRRDRGGVRSSRRAARRGRHDGSSPGHSGPANWCRPCSARWPRRWSTRPARDRRSCWRPAACEPGPAPRPSTSTSASARSSDSPAWSARARRSSSSSCTAPGRW